MSDFLSHMIEGGKPPKKNTTSTSTVLRGDQIPDLSEAISVLMYYAMNSPTGSAGVRELGEKVTILLPDVEVTCVDRQGHRADLVVGDYTITVERVK